MAVALKTRKRGFHKRRVLTSSDDSKCAINLFGLCQPHTDPTATGCVVWPSRKWPTGCGWQVCRITMSTVSIQCKSLPYPQFSPDALEKGRERWGGWVCLLLPTGVGETKAVYSSIIVTMGAPSLWLLDQCSNKQTQIPPSLTLLNIIPPPPPREEKKLYSTPACSENNTC